LTELSSRHSVLTKQKIFKNKDRIQSNSGKLTNWLNTGTSNQPMIIDDQAAEPILIREEEDEEAINIADIPEADELHVQLTRSAGLELPTTIQSVTQATVRIQLYLCPAKVPSERRRD
jgi:hypothetical protein